MTLQEYEKACQEIDRLNEELWSSGEFLRDEFIIKPTRPESGTDPDEGDDVLQIPYKCVGS